MHASLSYLVYAVLNDTCGDRPTREHWTLIGAFADEHTASTLARDAANTRGLAHRIVHTAEWPEHITVYPPYSAKE